MTSLSTSAPKQSSGSILVRTLARIRRIVPSWRRLRSSSLPVDLAALAQSRRVSGPPLQQTVAPAKGTVPRLVLQKYDLPTTSRRSAPVSA
jgi:hypothetical protein